MPVDLNDFKRFETSCNGRIVYNKKYMGYCIQCGRQRGYIFKAEDGKICKKCIQPKQIAILIANKDKGIAAAALVNKGRPGWNKGKKANKPAWNKGLKTSLIPDEHKRLKHSMRTALYTKMKEHGLSKSYQASFDLLGYSPGQLKSHLESLFEPGMSWDNYGDWHIDHKIPDSWFTYSTINDQGFKDCWALSNLQPMWAEENTSKGARYAGAYQQVGG